MKLLLMSRFPGDVQRIRDVLQSCGIECMVRGELLSGVAGDVPATECVPELWLINDNQLLEAQQVLEAWRSDSGQVHSAGHCLGCGEMLDPQFDSCWRCGAPR